MPKLTHPIGSLTTDIFGNGIILGYQYEAKGINKYHIYSFDDKSYAYRSDIFIDVKPPTPESIKMAQNLLLEIPNIPTFPYYRLKMGATFTIPCSYAPDLEYVILDNGHFCDNTLKFLIAYRSVNDKKWYIQYMNNDSNTFKKASQIICTDKSIKLAKTLLFERVIAPAFTV